MEVLKIESLSCGYGVKEVLKGISFLIKQGDFLGIVGPNGAGKTTLFRAMTKLLKPWQGMVCFQGKDIQKISANTLARKIAVIPQLLDITFSFTVEEFVAMGRFPHLGRFSKLSQKDHQIIENTLVLGDVAHLRERRMNELSGGERQRVILAQGFTQEPEVLLLDEPTLHLDITHQVKILDIIKNMNRNHGLTVAMALHDLNLASEYCDKLILLNEGKIFKDNTPYEVLTYQNIEEVYKTTVIVKENPISHKPYILLVSEEEKQKRKES